ncbi:Cysteine Protease [Melia azedarach]|nr:Cysteine Protease [Melia azedarach]
MRGIGSLLGLSAVAAVEGITAIKTGKLVSLSEQQLVDCATNGNNQGCKGGMMDDAFKYIIENQGIASEKTYPYEGMDGTCDKEKAEERAAQITKYEDVASNDEGALLNAVANQPVSVAIDASNLQLYDGGIFDGECGTSLNHGVTVVGYGTSEEGKKYWLIKNSWGSDWGEGGYFSSYENVPANDEEGLLNAVSRQPVSIGIDAYGDDFRHYQSGVFTGVCGTDLNHAVTIVGYGTTSTEEKFEQWIAQHGRTLQESSFVEKHEQWMAEYGRTYQDEAEKQLRLNIFKQNLEYVEKANKEGNRTYKLSVNKFSDLTNEEFRALYTGYKMPSNSRPSTTSFRYENLTDVPPSKDWRQEGAVTGIKQQGSCGCCWAFSAVGALEGMMQINTGKLIPLSEQQLLDCSTNYGNHGCNGGLMDNAFQYIIENQGIATETDYPYQEMQGTCDAQKAATAAARISKFEDLPANDEQALLNAVSMHPVSVCIEGGGQDFQNYRSGVFNGQCGTQCDHAVTLIGYGTSEDGMKYWLIKNSWGETWGENGYMRIQRDAGVSGGLCGIATGSSYPVA